MMPSTLSTLNLTTMNKQTFETRAQQLYALIALHPYKDELLCIMADQLTDELTGNVEYTDSL